MDIDGQEFFCFELFDLNYFPIFQCRSSDPSARAQGRCLFGILDAFFPPQHMYIPDELLASGLSVDVPEDFGVELTDLRPLSPSTDDSLPLLPVPVEVEFLNEIPTDVGPIVIISDFRLIAWNDCLNTNSYIFR